MTSAPGLVPKFSVTRLGDLLPIGQLFKACGNDYFTQNARILRQFFVKLSISFIFLVEIIFEQLLKTFGNFLLVTLSTPMDNRMTLTTFIVSHSFKIKPSRSLAVQSKFCNKSRCCKTAQSNFISNKSVNHFKREAPRHNLTLD